MRFDVTIKAEANVAPVAIGPTQIGLQLLRAVLAERFAFRAHRETRERPVRDFTPGYWREGRRR